MWFVDLVPVLSAIHAVAASVWVGAVFMSSIIDWPAARTTVETGHEHIPYLIAKLQESVNAYLAARAVLLLVMHQSLLDGSKIAGTVKNVAFPGLGTGVGGIGFNTCARQMRSAIEDTVLGQYKMPKSWAEASERHQLLYTDFPRRLQ